MSGQEPVTVAGREYARAINEHIDRPVPEAACGRYTVDVDELGGLIVWFPGDYGLRLDGDSASAKNVRGLLLALRAGAIA
jgi:hypothetical protein